VRAVEGAGGGGGGSGLGRERSCEPPARSPPPGRTPRSEICARLAESLPGGKDHFRPVTGLPVSTYFSAYKVAWLLENVPAVRAGALQGEA
jgi:hypothetical protein